ncbi:unnamed protein product [Staurois parvus]|uniref:Uncharacterized protein n=1 Tax=Staurois parvus TaxID=386267 RepID=A0ABN9HBG1_9NEOB|nr:unnamed protein product [Staurois parvus]
MGHRFEYDDPKLQRLLTIINDNVRIIGSPMVFLYNSFPSLLRWLPGSHNEVLPNLEELHAFIRETFTNQRKQLDVNDQRNVVDVFLVKQKEESQIQSYIFTDANLTFSYHGLVCCWDGHNLCHSPMGPFVNDEVPRNSEKCSE